MEQLLASLDQLIAAEGVLVTAALVTALSLATATLMAFGTPGVVVPATFAAEALAGPIVAVTSVSAGAMAGSLLLFWAARRWGAPRFSARLGDRLGWFERRFAAHGIWCVAGLRAVGAPHVVVTVGSALLPIRTPSFALASLLGFLPAIIVAATAGSLL